MLGLGGPLQREAIRAFESGKDMWSIVGIKGLHCLPCRVARGGDRGPQVEAGRAGSRREKQRGVTQTDGGCRWHSLDASGACSEWTDPSRSASGSGGS